MKLSQDAIIAPLSVEDSNTEQTIKVRGCKRLANLDMVANTVAF